MARRYVRDAKGRFAAKGYVGQTGGRGARLKGGKGNVRDIKGQKRGERHILRSSETKAASKRSLDASIANANLTLPKKLGGQGVPRDSFLGQAAARKKAKANAARKAAERKSGLPKSGGAMRVRGGIKRDPDAGAKLKMLSQENQGSKGMSKAAKSPSVTRKGARINPAKQADRASTAKVNRAMSAEKAARSAAFASKDSFNSPARQALNQKLNEATNRTAAEIQTRRNVRASFPVTKKTPTIKSSRPSSTVKAPKSTKSQRDRASQNLSRSLDSKGRAMGTKNRRTKRVAQRAAQFYKDPIKALKGVPNKGTGFRLPRSLRR